MPRIGPPSREPTEEEIERELRKIRGWEAHKRGTHLEEPTAVTPELQRRLAWWLALQRQRQIEE